jgi:hypothetical protein
MGNFLCLRLLQFGFVAGKVSFNDLFRFLFRQV